MVTGVIGVSLDHQVKRVMKVFVKGLENVTTLHQETTETLVKEAVNRIFCLNLEDVY